MNDIVRGSGPINTNDRKLSFIEINTLKLFGIYIIAIKSWYEKYHNVVLGAKMPQQ